MGDNIWRFTVCGQYIFSVGDNIWYLLSEGSISSVLEITFSVLLSEGSGILLFEGSNICGVDKVFIFKEDLLLFEGSIYHLKEFIQYCTVFSSLRFADWC